MPSPFEILKQGSDATAQSVTLFSSLLSRGLDAYSQGIRENIDVSQKLVSSAIQARQLDIEAWYKQQEVQNQTNSLDLHAKSLAVDTWYKSNEIQLAQNRANELLKDKQSADQSRFTIGLLSNTLQNLNRQYGDIKSQHTVDENTLKSYQEKLTGESSGGPLMNLFQGGVDRHVGIYSEIDRLQKSMRQKESAMEAINTNRENLQITTQNLLNGVINPQSASKSLRENAIPVPATQEQHDANPHFYNKIIDTPIPDPVQTQGTQSSTQSPINKALGLADKIRSIQNGNDFSQDDSGNQDNTPHYKKDTGISFEQARNGINIQSVFSKGRGQVINPLIDELFTGINPSTGSSYLSDDAKEKFKIVRNQIGFNYLFDLSTRFMSGHANEKSFDKDTEKAKEEFILNGGTDQEFQKIKQKFELSVDEFIDIADPKEKKIKIISTINDIIHPPEKPDNINEHGAIVPKSGSFGPDAGIIIGDDGRVAIKGTTLEERKFNKDYEYNTKVEEQVSDYTKVAESIDESIIKDGKLNKKKTVNALLDLTPDYFGLPYSSSSADEFRKTQILKQKKIIEDLVNNNDISSIRKILMKKQLSNTKYKDRFKSGYELPEVFNPGQILY